MNTFLHSGDLGDLCASLPAIRQLGGGKLILTESRDQPKWIAPRESLRGTRYAFIAPLLACQPYLSGVRWADAPKGVTHDMTTFRTIARELPTGTSLAHWQARFLGLTRLDVSRWLHVEPSPRSTGRIVIARSPRCRNGAGGRIWIAAVKRYRDRLLFVGMDNEREDMEQLIGPVEHCRVQDALELAEVIAGADRVISNQSFPAWLAHGLSAPSVLEVSPREPNTTIPRENCLYLQTAADIRAFESEPVQPDRPTRERQPV